MYLGNSTLKELIIGGGLDTTEHANDRKAQPDSYRLDIVPTAGLNLCLVDSMDFILEASNGDGTNYAVYRLKVGNVTYYIFYVHIKNARRGTLHRGDQVFDFTNLFVHIHIKENGYASSVADYLHYLPYFDPAIKISTNFGSTKYTGLNKGEQIPTGIIVNNSEMFTLTNTVVHCKATHTVAPFNVRSEPKSSSAKVGEVPIGKTWDTKIVATGENIQGVDRWYGYTTDDNKAGFVSGKWVEEVAAVVAVDPAELNQAKAKIEEQQGTINTLTDQLNKAAPIVQALKTISTSLSNL